MYCCDKLKEMIEETAIIHDDDSSWRVPGCCGVGCDVLEDIKYCPFCGHELST